MTAARGTPRADAARGAGRRGLLGSLALVAGGLVALLPRGACPACVAAYGGFLSALGVGATARGRVLAPLTVALLLGGVAGVAFSARRHGRRGPLWATVAGSAAVLAGRFAWNVPRLVYAGAALLLLAAAWNLRLRRAPVRLRLRRPAARLALAFALAAAGASPADARAQGHGPAYGLSTPTLGRGGWSLDVSAMGRAVAGSEMAMLRALVSYGITEDLQVSVSLPMPLRVPEGFPTARGMSRMPTTPDVEILLAWRLHREETGVGARFESTAYAGADYPTDEVRAGVRTAPGLVAALVTGYASRAAYLWAGALGRRYMTPVGPTADRPGDVAMYSLVVGYRPPAFRRDWPHPDWRVFVEVFGELAGRDRVGGGARPDTGGHRLFVAPTVLGLYGAWGISGGPAFPVLQRLNGVQPRETLRLVVNATFWF
jgi:hypothetical protein